MKPVISITPMKRAGKPEEIADLVFFLASNVYTFIKGEDFVIDGGFTAGGLTACGNGDGNILRLAVNS